jgi:hypothetical protein
VNRSACKRSAYAVYVRKTQTVCFDPERFTASGPVGLLRLSQVQDRLKEVFVHELLHHWQEEALATSKTGLKGLPLTYLREGHAVHFSHKLAETNGWRGGMSMVRTGSFRHLSYQRRTQAITDALCYMYAPLYVRKTGLKMKDFQKMLTPPPPSLLQMLGGSAESKNARTTWVLPEEVIPPAAKPKPADYLETVAYLCPCQYGNRYLAKQFQGAYVFQVKNGTVERSVLAVRFRDARAATAFVRACRWWAKPVEDKRSLSEAPKGEVNLGVGDAGVAKLVLCSQVGQRYVVVCERTADLSVPDFGARAKAISFFRGISQSGQKEKAQ